MTGSDARPRAAFIVPAALAGERIDRVVATVFSLSRSHVAALLASGGVVIDGSVQRVPSKRAQPGQELEVELPEVPQAPGPAPEIVLRVVYEDDDVVVVDKPAGLVVHPGAGRSAGTLVQGLMARYPDLADVGDPGRPGIVHRLDAGTSGLLVVARTEAARSSLVSQLAEHAVERDYAALVLGHLDADRGIVDAPIGRSRRDPTRMAVTPQGRPARTRYEVRARYEAPAALTLCRVQLETGRTHQVRVHMAAIGHPVAGDARYRGSCPVLGLPRPFLHAERLAFVHPVSGKRVELHSELPGELSAALDRCRALDGPPAGNGPPEAMSVGTDPVPGEPPAPRGRGGNKPLPG